jgi:hypothetical protein
MVDPRDEEPADDVVLDGEVVDATPVLAGPRGVRDPASAPGRGLRERIPGELVAQAAAVATAGFAAGAVTVAVARRRRSRKPVKRRAKDGTPTGVVVTRRFLVDVHLLQGD